MLGSMQREDQTLCHVCPLSFFVWQRFRLGGRLTSSGQGIVDAGRKAIGLPGASEDGYGAKEDRESMQAPTAEARPDSTSYGTYPRQFSQTAEKEWV